MQGAGNGGAAEAEGGEGSAAGRGSLHLSRRVGRKRSGRLGCACPLAKGSGREAFSGTGPRREAARCPLRWEPRYRVKEGPHRPERTNHCWCTVGQGAACRRWGSLRQLPNSKTRIRVEGHSAAGQGVSSYSPRRTAVCTPGLWFASFLASLWRSARHPDPVLLFPF